MAIFPVSLTLIKHTIKKLNNRTIEQKNESSMKERFSDLSKNFDEFQSKSQEFIDILVINENVEIIYKGPKVPGHLDDDSIKKIYKKWIGHNNHNDFFRD